MKFEGSPPGWGLNLKSGGFQLPLLRCISKKGRDKAKVTIDHQYEISFYCTEVGDLERH